MKAFSLGRVFVTACNQACGAPLIDRATTHELEGRMRTGKGLCIRAPFARNRGGRALVIGLWRT